MKKLISSLLLTYIKFFAKIALSVNKPLIIGITGSAGKTSARNAIYAILKDHKRTYMIYKGNSESGVPLGILGLHTESIGFSSIHTSIKDWFRIVTQAPFRVFFLKKYRYLIIEMGIDDPYPPRNMSYLLSIVKPHIAVILNVFPVHAEQFEKVISPPITDEKITAAIAHEKCKMVTDNPLCKHVIYNGSSEAITQELAHIHIPSETFGPSQEDALRYAGYTLLLEGTSYTFHLSTKKMTVEIPQCVLPEVFREVFASALLVGHHIGIDTETMISSLQKNFVLEPGRNSLFDGIDGTMIIDSSYNAPPDGVRSMLEMAYELKEKTGRPLAFVMGDMRELGSQAKQQHQELVPTITDSVDYLYTVGPITYKYIYSGLKSNRRMKDVQAFDGPHEIGQYLKKNPPKNAIILFKGSQNTIFLEEAIKYILKDSNDSDRLTRQEDYWLRKKQFILKNNSTKNILNTHV